MKKIYTLTLVVFSFLAPAQDVFKDVAPIFYARCTSCHNPKGIQPSYLYYSNIFPWISSIQNKITAGEMPPWHPDTTYSRFVNERLLPASEKTRILNWIANGAPKGDTTQAPTAPVYSMYKISAPPDLVLTIPTFTSNATSTKDSYVCFALPTGLTQDRILRAYEIIPGNHQIVHHVVVNVDTTGNINSDLSGNCYNITGQFGIGAYAPGSPPTVFPGQAPLKAGIRIKAGSKLILQNHYPIGSTGQVDSTQIRLYFYPVGTTGVRNIYVTTPLQHWGLNIPANTTKTYTLQTAPLSYSASVFAIFPHSHKVCTKITNFAYLGVDTVPLVKIDKWNFEWQGFYTFKKMPKVNQNMKLFGRHFYDNTINNPAISTPSNVFAGTDSDDEMFFDGWQYLLYQPGDENINVDSLLSNDSTFAISVKDVKPDLKNDLQTYAFPNPFENSVRIGYSLTHPLHVTVEIFNIYGQLIRVLHNGYETSGVHENVWDGKTNAGMKVSAGTYFYKVRAGNTERTGKLSVIPEK